MMMHFIMLMEDPVREVWIHPLNVERYTKGEFYRLYLDQRYFPDKFFENYRMSTLQFDDILSKIHHLIIQTKTQISERLSHLKRSCA